MSHTGAVTAVLAFAATLGLGACTANDAPDHRATLLNVSYDPTGELYEQENAAFIAQWQAQHHEHLFIQQSHGGSGKQARAIIAGLRGDVATLGSGYDLDVIQRQTQLMPADWERRLPDNSAPYTSTVVFVVRKGNPKNIRDWGDLARPGMQVITPNPKSSSGARWNYLAAWAWAMRQPGATDRSAREYMRRLFTNAPVLDSGARGSMATFLERGIGDVMIAWESDALLARERMAPGQVEIVVPSISILAEPPVTVLDGNAERHGARALAEAYLQFLYTRTGQEIIARNFFRPRDPVVAAQYAAQFPRLELVTIDGAFGGWSRAQATHFNDGGTFDDIYRQ